MKTYTRSEIVDMFADVMFDVKLHEEAMTDLNG